MPFALDSLVGSGISTIKYGMGKLARNNRFSIELEVPEALRKGDNDDILGLVDKLSYYARSAPLPGRSFATEEKRIGNRSVIHVPYNIIYSDYTINFVVDNSYDLKKLFKRWNHLIRDPDNNSFEFPEVYEGKLSIHALDRNNRVIHSIKMNKVFPKQIQDIIYENDSENTYALLPVVFSYYDFDETEADDSFF